MLEKISDKHYKKIFLKACEKDLRSQFEDELKGLTVSQGRVLMKLIDRETGKTTYELVKQLRGNFQAVDKFISREQLIARRNFLGDIRVALG